MIFAKPFAIYFLVLSVVGQRVNPDRGDGEKKVTMTFCFAVSEGLIFMSFLLTLLLTVKRLLLLTILKTVCLQ